jgi:hypothetical protein
MWKVWLVITAATAEKRLTPEVTLGLPSAWMIMRGIIGKFRQYASGLPLSARIYGAYAADTGPPYAGVASIAELGAARRASGQAQGWHRSSLKVKTVGMMKTRISGWVGRWRERHLAREQKRQTSAARQAKRAAQAGQSHTLGQGGSGGG